MAKILSVLLVLVLAALPLFCDEADARKKELADVKSQTAQKEKELKKYREKERKISKEISDLETQKARAQQLKDKVASDLSYVAQNLLSTQEKRDALGRSRPLWEGAFEQLLSEMELRQNCAYCTGGYSLEEEIFVGRMATHEAAFLAGMRNEEKQTRARLEEFTQKNQQLQEKNSEIMQQQEQLLQSFQQKKKDLDSTKKQVTAVRKEIDELKKSAKELNKLLASFERKRKEEAKKQTDKSKKTTATIAVPRHSLQWPAEGKVISKFGKEYREDLNTWIFRDGIKIAAQKAAPVSAVSQGSVIFAGPFRSYGNVVILDHGKGFFTIYGFLQQISVNVGDKVDVGGQVGLAGKDTQSSSGTGQNAVYFEIRQGTTAVDPLDWLVKK